MAASPSLETGQQVSGFAPGVLQLQSLTLCQGVDAARSFGDDFCDKVPVLG